MLTALAEEPTTSAGYRGSDLVHWRDSDPLGCTLEFRFEVMLTRYARCEFFSP
jgi:hypothetical protein